MKDNRVCITCGKLYSYCGSCSTNVNLPVWKTLFDTENCKTIFETISDYAQKVITKETAKEKLSKCNLSQNNTLKEKIQKIVDEIINEEDIESTVKEIKRNNTKKKTTVTNENND